MTTLSAAITELKLELSKRRQTWARIPGETVLFSDMEHQRRYKVLEDLLEVLQHMHPKEYGTVVARIERIREDQENQTKLF